MAGILGPDGQPIRMETLAREEMTPSVTGISSVFDDVVAPFLNPAKLAAILRQAAEGDLHDFLTLAEEIEEREPQYRSVLSTRKTAIKSIEPFVKAATEDAEDVAIADAVKDELVNRPDFRPLVGNLLDGLGKGFSIVEAVWEMNGNRWDIASFIHRDPRLFQLDKATQRSFRMRMKDEPAGRPLRPMKYLIHVPDLKTGLPARNGLARIAAWSFMLKSFTLKDWAAFIEVHGMPLRLGKYGPGASPKDRSVLLNAVRSLGADAAAIIPLGMEIEFVEVKGFSEKPFESLANYLDKQISKLIIGQTMTADDGSSKAQAAIHDKVRIDIKEDDAVDMAVTLNRDMVRPWVDVNFGPRPRNRYPTIVLPVLEREDMTALATAISNMVDRGLEIEQAEVRDRFGFREPARAAKLMAPARSAPAASVPGAREPGTKPAKSSAASDDDDDDPAARPYRLDPRQCPGCGTTERLQADDGSADPDERDLLVEEELAQFEKVMNPVRDALEAAFAAARSYEELDQALVALASRLPVEELAKHLAILGMKGFGNGATGDTAP